MLFLVTILVCYNLMFCFFLTLPYSIFQIAVDIIVKSMLNYILTSTCITSFFNLAIKQMKKNLPGEDAEEDEVLSCSEAGMKVCNK